MEWEKNNKIIKSSLQRDIKKELIGTAIDLMASEIRN